MTEENRIVKTGLEPNTIVPRTPGVKNQSEPGFVKVVIGDAGASVIPIDEGEQVTVGEVLKRAGHRYNDGQSVSINSKMVTNMGTIVSPGDKINVIERVANG